MKPEPALAELKNAVKDLLYQSESDEPFEVLTWQDSADSCDWHKIPGISYSKKTPVQTVTIPEFFKDLVTDQTWHGEEEKAAVLKYRILKAAIEKHMTNPQVFRIGEVNVDIWIVGKIGSGSWVGVRTKAVET